MRLIDAVSLSEGIELHRKSTDQECEMDRQWAVGYNAGLDRALYSIAYAKTITPPPNDPLTLDELREMDGDPVYDWMGYEWFVVSEVTDDEVIMTDGTVFDIDEDSVNSAVGRFYRRKLEEGTI